MDSLPESAKSIFLSALDIESTDERESFLSQACGDNGDLRQEVEKLLDHQNQAGSFLESPAVAADLAPTVDHHSSDYRGTQIGRYKIRELIGEGGMGVVYVAEQERPLRRKVALKVIKPGMDSKAVLGRFEAERNALALMNHPNIAKVLDAGTTEKGRPYFVMELVNGIPITQYCDDQKLSIRDRLSLFIDVCSAIQHAHQKGIIHRDIKPSNVLVTELDGKPIAKVIDFGVAKALNQSLTEHSVYTAFQTVIGTPLYMSPEQATFSAVDVDTRSDVYSLGVLLYELLTGSTPFTKDDFKQAAQDEVFRLIREREPQRPSNRISSLGETVTRVSQLRRSQPEQLGRIIRGDLDWIVMKALAKERGRRYRTADAFAEDIERHLRDLPIEARPDSTGYRLSRFYRRNTAAVLTGGLVTLMTCVSLIVMFYQASALRKNVAVLREKNTEIEASKERADRERQTAMELLDQNRELAIQRILVQAFEGDIDEVNSIIDEYADVLNDKDLWPSVLRACAHWHAGRYREAQKLLQPLAQDPKDTNIPVLAMLSASYIYDGQWNEGIVLANVLREAAPRDEFQDLDQLFLSYGLIFVEPKRARELLLSVLDRNPTWLVCHGMLADISMHLGNIKDDSDLIEFALQRSNAVLELMGDNPFALNVNLFAHRITIERLQIENRDYTHLIAPAESLVARLKGYPEFILAHAMPGQYFDAIEDKARGEDAWTLVLEQGGCSWRYYAYGRLYWNKTSPELLKLIERQDRDKKATCDLAARAYALTDIPGGKIEAMSIFHELSETRVTAYDEFMAIQILLLLGEKEQAIKTAQSWWQSLESSLTPDGKSSSVYSDEFLIKIVATDGDWLPDQGDRVTRLLTSHMLGMLALADGDRAEAKRHFADSSAKPFINLDIYWSEAFLRRLIEDLNWPCQNAKMQSL